MNLRLLSPLLTALLAFLPSVLAAQEAKLWTLRECIDYALENNIRYKQTQLGVETAEIGYNQARANQLPNLNGNTSFNNNFGRSVDPFTNTFVSQNFNSVSLGVSSNVTLFNGFTIRNGIRQSQLDLMASQMDMEQQEMDVVLNVSLAYLNVLFNAEIVESAAVQVAATREQRDRTAKLVQAGNLAPADLIQIESQIATEELNLVNAQNQLELSYLSLMQVMTLPPGEKFGIVRPELDDPDLNPVPISTDEVFQTALGVQPFIKAGQYRIESAAKGIEIARGNLYPRLSLTGFFNTGYSNVRSRPTDEITLGGPTPVVINGENSAIQFFQGGFEKYPFFDQMIDQRSFGIAFGLSVPIYNQSQVKNAIKQRQIQMETAQLNAQLNEQTLRQTIEQAYADARTAYSTFKATNKQVESLALVYDNAEKQFNVGLINSVDFLLAKTNVNRARFDLVRAKFNYLFRLQVLDFYQGKPLGF